MLVNLLTFWKSAGYLGTFCTGLEGLDGLIPPRSHMFQCGPWECAVCTLFRQWWRHYLVARGEIGALMGAKMFKIKIVCTPFCSLSKRTYRIAAANYCCTILNIDEAFKMVTIPTQLFQASFLVFGGSVINRDYPV